VTPEAERLETEAWWSYQDLRAATRRPLGPWPTDAQLEDAYEQMGYDDVIDAALAALAPEGTA